MPVQQMQTQETSYKPWGLTAGAMVGQQQYDQEAANQLALQESQLGNVIKGVEAGRAQADFSNPEMETARQQGILGENRGKYAEGRLKYDTLDSNTKRTLAENIAKTSKAEIEATVNGLDMFISTAEANGPLGMQQALSGLPPQYQKIVQLMEQKEPGSSPRYAKQLRELIKSAQADTSANRGTIAVNAAHEKDKLPGIALHNAGSLATAVQHGKDQREVEQMRINAGKYADKNKDRLVLFSKMNPTAQKAAVSAALVSGVDPITRERMDNGSRSYWSMYEESMARSEELKVGATEGKVDLSRIPGVNAVPRPTSARAGQTSNGTRTTKSGNTVREVK